MTGSSLDPRAVSPPDATPPAPSLRQVLDACVKGERVLLLDGGLASELESRGHSLDDPLWSARLLLEDPHAIASVHLDYLFAGARILTTASYQATFEGLKSHGLSRQEAADLLRDSVSLAVQAREDLMAGTPSAPPVWIAASIGPYGAMLHDGSEYRGNYGLTKDDLSDFHRARLETLAETEADLLACETLPSIEEAESLLPLLEACSKSAWLSFTCKSEKSLCHGEPIEAAARLVNSQPAILAVGINCTPPRFVRGLVERLRSHTSKPIVVYPNSGETWNNEQRCWMGDASIEDWLATAEQWRAAGATIIGGCCRTTPAHISAMRRLFETS